MVGKEMPEFTHKAALIVATKDRPGELRTMLKSLVAQSHLPEQVVIVDASAEPDHVVVQEFAALPIKYIAYKSKPSASGQRNYGLSAVSEDCDLIGFLDDDTEFESDSLKNMMTFWESAPDDLGGAAFNMVNHPELTASCLKSSSLAERLGLYSKRKGMVLPSGFHTMIGCVNETTLVDWLPTTAVIWRKEIFNEHRFDEWFEGYSYLEDLDFSYSVGKKHKLAVVWDARYYHYPALSGRGGSYVFGKREVQNRVYFVRKHGLSLMKCRLGLSVRLLMSFSTSLRSVNISCFQRCLGNCAGLMQSFLQSLKR
jgi:glycosyltransferase involved in cell wall biosynthesis